PQRPEGAHVGAPLDRLLQRPEAGRALRGRAPRRGGPAGPQPGREPEREDRVARGGEQAEDRRAARRAVGLPGARPAELERPDARGVVVPARRRETAQRVDDGSAGRRVERAQRPGEGLDAVLRVPRAAREVERVPRVGVGHVGPHGRWGGQPARGAEPRHVRDPQRAEHVPEAHGAPAPRPNAQTAPTSASATTSATTRTRNANEWRRPSPRSPPDGVRSTAGTSARTPTTAAAHTVTVEPARSPAPASTSDPSTTPSTVRCHDRAVRSGWSPSSRGGGPAAGPGSVLTARSPIRRRTRRGAPRARRPRSRAPAARSGRAAALAAAAHARCAATTRARTPRSTRRRGTRRPRRRRGRRASRRTS